MNKDTNTLNECEDSCSIERLSTTINLHAKARKCVTASDLSLSRRRETSAVYGQAVRKL